MSSVNEMEGGKGRGFRADIAADGAVRGFPGDSTVATMPHMVDNAGATVLAARRDGRRAVQIQNLHDAGILYVRLDDGAMATFQDLRVHPGEVYTFPAGVSWEGQISGIASVTPLPALVLEFYLVPEAGTM